MFYCSFVGFPKSRKRSPARYLLNMHYASKMDFFIVAVHTEDVPLEIQVLQNSKLFGGDMVGYIPKVCEYNDRT